MVFVLDINDYTYQYFTTDAVKKLVESLPPIGMLPPAGFGFGFGEDDPCAQSSYPGLDDVLWQRFGGYVLCPVLFAVATALYQGLCHSVYTNRYWEIAGWQTGVPILLIMIGCFGCRMKRA